MSGTDYTQTTNYGLYKPLPNADINQWGSHLNLNADTLDGLLHTVQTGAPFLPLAGGTVTGATTLGAGGNLTGTFAGNPAWSGAHTFGSGSGGTGTGLTVNNSATVLQNATVNGSVITPHLNMGAANGLGQSIAWAAAAGAGPANNALWINETITGTPATAGNPQINAIIIRDGLQMTGGGHMSGLSVAHNYGGAAAAGSRTALESILNVGTGGAVTNAGFYLAGYFSTDCTVNLGGTSLAAPGTTGGIITGANINASTSSGATFINGLKGGEIDVYGRAGSSFGNKVGWLINCLDATVMGAWGTDTGLAIGGGWNYGITFSQASVPWAFAPGATLLYVPVSQSPDVAPANPAWGIDFSSAAFTVGFARSVGFMVDPSGNVSSKSLNVGNWQIAPAAGGLSINAVGQSAASFAIATPGTAFPGDIRTTAYGGVYRVTHVHAVGVSVAHPGSGGANGAVTLQGVGGTGTPFQVTGTISGGALQAAGLAVTVAGDYTALGLSSGNWPVTPISGGAGLTGCTLTVSLAPVTIVQLVADTSASPPANPVATSSVGANFFSPANTSLMLNLTWTASNAVMVTLANAVSDVAAATAGVPISGLYRNGNAVQVRLT